MVRMAILGAGGFIGNRAVEMLHLGGRFEVIPVVRTAQSLALASRFELDSRVADGRDKAALGVADNDKHQGNRTRNVDPDLTRWP